MNAFESATCPNCQAVFDRLPVERDEDAAYVVFPVHACGECGLLLCDNCEHFECDGCSGTFCQEHLVRISDGTPKPLQCCTGCAREIAAEEQRSLAFPPPIPLRPERSPAGRAIDEEENAEPMCPDCGSLHIIGEFHHGRADPETGYDDSGEMFRCRDCGARGPAEDVLPHEPAGARPGEAAEIPCSRYRARAGRVNQH